MAVIFCFFCKIDHAKSSLGRPHRQITRSFPKIWATSSFRLSSRFCLARGIEPIDQEALFAIWVSTISFPFFQFPHGGIGEAKEHGFRFVTINIKPSVSTVIQAFKINAIPSSDGGRNLVRDVADNFVK